MTITPKTKVSDVIAANPDAIEAIASLNARFGKLKNPVLRKMLAGRVNLEQAAKIGKTDVHHIMEALKAIGMSVKFTCPDDQEVKNAPAPSPELKHKPAAQYQTLDVRQYIKEGHDPFSLINNTLKKLPQDRILKLINTFEPVPLINIMSKRGYDYAVEHQSEALIITYFQKAANKQVSKQDSGKQEDYDKDKFNTVLSNYQEHDIETLSVKGLEMPMPMQIILETLENMAEDKVLYVHHFRIPQLLLPELENRGYQYQVKEVDENNVKLIIYDANRHNTG